MKFRRLEMKNLIVFVTIVVALSACEEKKKIDMSDACKSGHYSQCKEGDVYLFNICGEEIGKIEECSENEKCEEAECVPCEETSACESKGCYEGNVYCFSNCGKRKMLVKECEDGTTCSNGKCVECEPVELCVEKKCYDGNVFCYTDCGNRGELDEVCAQTEVCEGGACLKCDVTEPCETKKCVDSVVYCYDNCGKEGELFQECESYETCEDGECNCTPDCNGKNCGTDGCGGTCGECTGTDECVSGTCGSKVDMEGPEYKGDVLLIINTGTNGSQSSFSGTLPLPVLKDNIVSKSDGTSFVRKYFDPGVRIPGDLDLSQRPAKIIRSVPAPAMDPVAGDTQNFWVADFGSGGDREITATLQHISSKCEVWAEYPSITGTTKARQICEEFDSVIYPMVTTNFHPESDINSDGRIAFLIADLGGFAAGYFTPADFYSKEEYYGSNERDMVYIEQDMDISQIRNTIAHEFQHLCYANRNFLIEQDNNYSDLDVRWIDEGLATASEHLYGGSQSDWVYIFNTSPYNDPVAQGNGFFKWDYSDTNRVYSDYALTYAFFQYLRLQSPDQDGIYNEIILNTKNDWDGVQDVIRSRIDGDMNFSDFMTGFRIAMLLNDAAGPYGFMGDTGLKFTPRFYTGSGRNVEGGGALYFKISGSFTEPADKGAGIIYVGITTK